LIHYRSTINSSQAQLPVCHPLQQQQLALFHASSQLPPRMLSIHLRYFAPSMTILLHAVHDSGYDSVYSCKEFYDTVTDSPAINVWIVT